VEFADASTDRIEFPYIPAVSADSVIKRAFSAWIKLDTISASYNRTIISTYTNATSGFDFAIIGNATYKILGFYDNEGEWICPNDAISLSAWTHVMVYQDRTVYTNAPVIYINGVAQSLTESSSPTNIYSEAGLPLIIGNHSADSYNMPFDGQIKDLRVYNMDLTTTPHATLAAALHTAGANGAGNTAGMVFRTFQVNTADLASYIDQTLTGSDKVQDVKNGYLGTPGGSPVGRAV
jgi:hypothetical protein